MVNMTQCTLYRCQPLPLSRIYNLINLLFNSHTHWVPLLLSDWSWAVAGDGRHPVVKYQTCLI